LLASSWWPPILQAARDGLIGAASHHRSCQPSSEKTFGAAEAKFRVHLAQNIETMLATGKALTRELQKEAQTT
jgi:hypothetical protein